MNWNAFHFRSNSLKFISEIFNFKIWQLPGAIYEKDTIFSFPLLLANRFLWLIYLLQKAINHFDTFHYLILLDALQQQQQIVNYLIIDISLLRSKIEN